jgi:hypothetical protein
MALLENQLIWRENKTFGYEADRSKRFEFNFVFSATI